MRQGARSAVTIVVLGTILAIGAVWGWRAMTEPFPGKADASACVTQAVQRGEKVYPDQVVVSVLNAGSREGLAGRTMGLLVDEGFREGDSGWSDQGVQPTSRGKVPRAGSEVTSGRFNGSRCAIRDTDSRHLPLPGPVKCGFQLGDV